MSFAPVATRMQWSEVRGWCTQLHDACILAAN